MKIGLSSVTLAGAAVLALGVSVATAGVASGEGQTSAKAQAAMNAQAWYQAEAHFFEGMTRSQVQRLRQQLKHQTSRRPLRPDDRAGLRGIVD